MRVKRRKTMALLAAVSIVCAQSTVSDVFAAGAEEVAYQFRFTESSLSPGCKVRYSIETALFSCAATSSAPGRYSKCDCPYGG